MGDESDHAKKTRLEFETKLVAFLADLYRYVSSWINNKSDVEDTVNEVILRAWCYMEDRKWEPVIKNFEAFIITIARNLRNDLWSKRKKEGLESLESRDADEPGRDPVQSYDLAAIIERRVYIQDLYRTLPLQIILQDLDEYELRILYKKHAEDMKLAEIAEEEKVDIHLLRFQFISLHAKIRYRARRYIEETGNKSLF
jgi:RNA polymerase sigma factor (sigma-70 family)